LGGVLNFREKDRNKKINKRKNRKGEIRCLKNQRE